MKDDLWEYDVATDRFSQVPGPPPPRGMPTADFMRVPLLYHAQSRSLFTIQTATSSFVPGGFAAWPRPELWRFDSEVQRWSRHDTEEVPRFVGSFARIAGPEGRLFLFGGGADGEGLRPALSREVYWLEPAVTGHAVALAPPRAPEIARIQGAEVELRFSAAEALEVFRARADVRLGPGPEEKLSASPVASGTFVDRRGEAGVAGRHRLRRSGGGAYSLPAFTQPRRPSGLVVFVESAELARLSWDSALDPGTRFHVDPARAAGGRRRS